MMTGSKVFVVCEILVIIAVLATADENGDNSVSNPSRVARFSEADERVAQNEVLGDTQVRIVRSPDKITENNKKQHKKKNIILKSKMRKAAKQPHIEKIKSIRNRKRKGKYGGRNTNVLTGESCDFIDFGSVRNVGAGCTDGTKMVVKNK